MANYDHDHSKVMANPTTEGFDERAPFSPGQNLPLTAGSKVNPVPVEKEFVQAFIFLFLRPEKLVKLWWVPLICWVPFVNLLAIKGWRLDIVRRRMRGHDDVVPDLADLGRFLADGWWLFVASSVFHLPLVLLLALSVHHTYESIMSLFEVAGQQLSSKHGGGFSLVFILVQLAFEVLVKLAAPITYHYLLKPFLYAGLLRYAATGRARSLFNVTAQVRLVFGQLGSFLKIALLCFVVGVVVNLFSVVVLSTLLGAALIPLVSIPLYNAATGYLLGSLGLELNKHVPPAVSPIAPLTTHPPVPPSPDAAAAPPTPPPAASEALSTAPAPVS